MSWRGPAASGPAQAEPTQLTVLPAADAGRPAAPITGGDSSAPVRFCPGRQPAWCPVSTPAHHRPGSTPVPTASSAPTPAGVTGECAPGPRWAGEERWSYGTRASRRAEAAMAHAPAAPRKPGTARAAQGPSGRQRDHPAATSACVHLRLASGRPAVSAFPPPTGWHGLRCLARRRGWGRPRGLTSAPSSWPGRGNRGLLLPGTRPRPGRGKAWTRPSTGSD